jgi:hypothetical protein
MSGDFGFPSRRAAVSLGLALALLLGGCSRMASLGFDAQSAFGSVSLVDRCADFMHRAFPESAIEVSDSRVSAQSDSTIVDIAAIRSAVPAGSLYARDVGVECRFENGILTGFRWTKGPVRP